MPHNYLQDAKKTIDALSRDEGLTREERLILLFVLADYLADVTKRMQDEEAEEDGGQRH